MIKTKDGNYRYTEEERHYFEVPAEELAPWLIGKILCYKEDSITIKGRIFETEAYRECDKSTDANRGNAGSTQLLSGGHLHYRGGRSERLDIVAGPEGTISSVLIRSIDPYGSHPTNSLRGFIDTKHFELDGIDLLLPDEEKAFPIWLEDDGVIVELHEPMPRIGLNKNDSNSNDLMRFRAKQFIFKSE